MYYVTTLLFVNAYQIVKVSYIFVSYSLFLSVSLRSYTNNNLTQRHSLASYVACLPYKVVIYKFDKCMWHCMNHLSATNNKMYSLKCKLWHTDDKVATLASMRRSVDSGQPKANSFLIITDDQSNNYEYTSSSLLDHHLSVIHLLASLKNWLKLPVSSYCQFLCWRHTKWLGL